MIDSDRYGTGQFQRRFENINRQIVELGEKFKKLVVATCDVHFWIRRMKYTAGSSWRVRALRMRMIRLLFPSYHR